MVTYIIKGLYKNCATHGDFYTKSQHAQDMGNLKTGSQCSYFAKLKSFE